LSQPIINKRDMDMDKIRTKFFIFIIFKNQDYITDMPTKMAIKN
jgi:hypothetical protein